MPGNDIGDRVYNFFDQNSFSQNQRHTQLADANWPGFHNNVWVQNERQNSVPLNSSSKCYNDQQSEIERGNNHFSTASHGLNFTQSNVRPEFVKSPSQVQQNLNGFMHTRQVGNLRQNEGNFIAVDRGSDQHNITSRVPSIVETQQSSVQQHNNSASFGGTQAPMNFNFLGSQQQMSSQQPGMLNDGRVMQQQVIMKQMQELQRRQQLQQFEAMQNAMNHRSNFPSQSAGPHSLANNSNPVQDTSNNPWQSQVMAGGTNWQQPGNPYLNGLMVNPEQGQAMRFRGLTPQQASHSLYGVPVSSSGGVHQFQQNSVERPGVSHIPAHSNTFSGNSYASNLEQVSTQDASTTSRLEGKVSFEHPFSQGLQNTVTLGGSNQVQERKSSMPDGNERGFVGASDESSEKSSMQAAASQSISSQAGVGLDPTEEKILFGNDNIWEAFGGAAVTGNDGPDLFNGFPSMQSGTWSALMQSAVAETSNSDGMQEEWNGLDSQTSRSQSSNQHFPTPHDNGKPPPAWIDSSQRASLGSRMTNNDVNTNSATLDTNYLNNSRLLQSHSNQGTSSIENQALQEGRRWLDSNSPKSHTEEKCDSKPDTAFWSHRQSTFLPESVPVSNTNSKVDSGGPSLSHINNSPVPNQIPPDNHNLDLWKQFNFVSKSGTVGHGNDQHNMNKGQSVVGSSGNTPSGGAAEMSGIQNCDGRENSIDIQQNSTPNYALSGSLRENVWSDAGDRQFLPGPQEISSGPASRRVPIVHKFQYHAMGDMNVDKSSSAKQVVHSQSMSPSLGPRVHEVQPTLLGQAGLSSSNMEKGQVYGFHRGVKMLHGTLSSNVHPGQLPRTSVPLGSSVENSSPNQRPSPSQNMLELLHKVDQSKEQNSVSNLGSSLVNYYNKSDTPADGRVGPGQSQSSMSHGFNLQLAPPSQGTALSNLNDPSQSSLRSVASPGSRIVSSEKGDTTQAWLPSSSSTLCSPSHRPTEMDFRNSEQLMDDHKSSFISPDSHAYHDQQPMNSQNQVAVSQCTSNLYNNSMSEDMNLSGVRASMYQMPTSLNAVTDGMMKDNMPLAGPNSRSSQQLSGIQAHNTSDFVKSHFQSNDSSDTNVMSQQKKDELDCPRKTDVSHEVDPQPSAMTIGLSQETYLRRQSTEASPVNSAVSQNEADVFNHSLKPNNTANYSYSLLHQMQTMKAMGMDPNHHESKRLKGSEIGRDAPQMTSYCMVRDPSVSQTSMSSGDAKLVSFPPQLGNSNISLLPPGAVASQDGFSFGHSDPQTFVNVTNRAQLTGISPQMAPSWFERYATFRNGQLLPVHNVPRVPMVKNVEQQLIKPPINLVDTCQISGTNQISNVSSATEHISSLHALAPNVASPTPVSTSLKKRKTETSDLIPWNKEIVQGFKKVQNISSAEVEWAQSSNRLVERGGDETDFHEYLSPMVRPGRRLILTTKLMQQVFCPPPASILSLDGRSNCEVIMYSVARLALADASNLICGVESDTPADSGISVTAKAKKTERIRDQYFLKVVEDFTNRATALENDLLRLDKSASILDFRLDCQDLERFSVINRFARFHARSQGDGVESSLSSNATAVSQKPFPQRYVIAHPMPSTVPERVQCLNIN